MNRNQLRAELTALRKKANLTVKGMASLMGLRTDNYKRVEHGVNNRAPTALQLRMAKMIAYNVEKGQLEELAKHLNKEPL